MAGKNIDLKDLLTDNILRESNSGCYNHQLIGRAYTWASYWAESSMWETYFSRVYSRRFESLRLKRVYSGRKADVEWTLQSFKFKRKIIRN